SSKIMTNGLLITNCLTGVPAPLGMAHLTLDGGRYLRQHFIVEMEKGHQPKAVTDGLEMAPKLFPIAHGNGGAGAFPREHPKQGIGCHSASESIGFDGRC